MNDRNLFGMQVYSIFNKNCCPVIFSLTLIVWKVWFYRTTKRLKLHIFNDFSNLFTLDLSTQLFTAMNASATNALGNKINDITAHPNTTLRSLNMNRNNCTNLSRLSPLVSLHNLHIEYNGLDHINFTHFSQATKVKSN